MKGHNNKFAFTLAEVLITLGIIGIVAALTMPALIGNYQKKEVTTRLKKAYSIVQQAIKMSELDNGEIQFWDTNLSGNEFFNKYFKNYFQYINQYTSTELWNIAPRENLSGSAYTGTTYKSGNKNSYHISLADGTLITLNLDSPSENGLWVGIDTNGISKPNRIGKDTFLFFFSTAHGLQPLGGAGTPSTWLYGTYNRNNIKGNNGNACNKQKNGYWCSALIMNDGWEIKKDYPW